MESLSLWQGLKISLDIGIKTLYIVGNSMMIIQKCIKLLENITFLEDETSLIMVRITYFLNKIEKVHMFHMLPANNHLVDDQANAGVLLKQGQIFITPPQFFMSQPLNGCIKMALYCVGIVDQSIKTVVKKANSLR